MRNLGDRRQWRTVPARTDYPLMKRTGSLTSARVAIRYAPEIPPPSYERRKNPCEKSVTDLRNLIIRVREREEEEKGKNRKIEN